MDYDRTVLVDILVYHWRTNNSGCGCGWGELGRSHPEHVADIYEESMSARSKVDRTKCVCGHIAGIHLVDGSMCWKLGHLQEHRYIAEGEE